jgi:hypothetical protein
VLLFYSLRDPILTCTASLLLPSRASWKHSRTFPRPFLPGSRFVSSLQCSMNCLSPSGSRLEQRFTSKSTPTYPPVPLILGKIFSQVLFLRKSHGTRLSIFSPVNDLSSLSKSGPQQSLIRGKTNDVAISGGQVLGDEYSDHVVKVCSLADKCVVGPLHPIIEPERHHFARGVSSLYYISGLCGHSRDLLARYSSRISGFPNHSLCRSRCAGQSTSAISPGQIFMLSGSPRLRR